MNDISLVQYNLVVNMFSFTIGTMGAAAIFFYSKSRDVLPKYRTGVTLLALVSAVACYNYFRLLFSWKDAFSIMNGVVTATGIPYDDSYRYADWLFTVPLLLIALVLVLDLPARQARNRGIILGLLAAEMIVLGYPGLITTRTDARWVWWAVAMVPFTIIMYQLYVTMAKIVDAQPEAARRLVSRARFATLLSWSFYPAIYLLPLAGVVGTAALISTQIGYAVADMVAKAVYGVLICAVAVSKSQPAVAVAPETRLGAVAPG